MRIGSLPDNLIPGLIPIIRSLKDRIKTRLGTLKNPGFGTSKNPIGTLKNPKNGKVFKTNKNLKKGSFYTTYRSKDLNQNQDQNQDQDQNQSLGEFFPEPSPKFGPSSKFPQKAVLGYLPKSDPLLDEIMSLPNLPKHKLSHVGTPNRVYQDASSYLRLLQRGVLFLNIAQSKNDLNARLLLKPDWCKKFQIEHHHATSEFTRWQIITVFHEIAKAYTIGYAPLDKKTLPKSITGIILNSWGGTSMFLKVFVNGVKPVAELINGFNRKQLTEQERNVLDILLCVVADERTTAIGSGKVTPEEEYLLRRVAKRLIEEYDKRLRLIGDEFHGWPSMFDLVNDYAGWLRQRKGGIGKVRWLGPDGYDWEKFLASRDITPEMIAERVDALSANVREKRLRLPKEDMRHD